jgi:hypothetical protein
MSSTPLIALRTPWLVIRLHVDRAGPVNEAARARQAGFAAADREESRRALARLALCDPDAKRIRIDEMGLLEPPPGPAEADFAARSWM